MDRALHRPLENQRILVVEDDPIIALDLQVSGVAAIYNRHAYMDEMRVAIINWETRIAEIVAQT